jgi:hypothetical protein
MIFGDFSRYLLAYWGGLVMEVQRDRNSAIAGQSTVVAQRFFNAAPLNVQYFSAFTDAIA